MSRARVYQTPAERQKAYRTRKHGAASHLTELVALQDDAAHWHVGTLGKRVSVLQREATALQRRLHRAHKERDMLDALWTLQTLIADFGYDEVYASVLQHVLQVR